MNENVFKEMSNYSDVYLDRAFALELIPVVELIMTTTDAIKKIAREELPFFKKIYIKRCDQENKETKLYKEILEDAISETRLKIYMLLEALYDVINENTLKWNIKWKMKPYHRIEYNEVDTDTLGIKAVVLEPKPEYLEKYKENEKLKKYNEKQMKICQKWRDSNIKWYKKILKIINN